MTSPDSFEPKWTPGKWSVVDRDGIYTITSPEGNPLNCYEVADTWRVKADAELIALAPELAAAVLAYERWDDDWETPGSDESFDAACVELNRLADRLRMIGADE